jgi:hypothetical protein
VLVPRYGGTGAAVTQCLSFAILLLGITSAAQLRFPLKLEWIRLASVTVLILLSGLLMAPSWNESAALSLLLKLPFGMTITVIASWVMAPDWCLRGVWYLQRLITASVG